MRKVVIERLGDPDVLEIVSAESPTPQAGRKFLVQVQAAGINYIDVYQRRGHLQVPTPFTPGYEESCGACLG